jgi:hypothetical protein
MNSLIIISILVFALNIPFGYWRANVPAFSRQWFLAIHMPVPFIIAMRIFGGIGFSWYTYVFLVAGFFLGQRFGGLLLKWIHKRCQHAGSCLVMDLYRCART